MVKCAKRGCKAHALRGKKYCLFHTNQYNDPEVHLHQCGTKSLKLIVKVNLIV